MQIFRDFSAISLDGEVLCERKIAGATDVLFVIHRGEDYVGRLNKEVTR